MVNWKFKIKVTAPDRTDIVDTTITANIDYDCKIDDTPCSHTEPSHMVWDAIKDWMMDSHLQALAEFDDEPTYVVIVDDEEEESNDDG